MAEHDYSQDYLTIEAISSGAVIFSKFGYFAREYAYRLNNGSWQNITLNRFESVSIDVEVGDKIEWSYKSGEGGSGAAAGEVTFSGTTCFFSSYGNILSLAWGDDYLNPPMLPMNHNHWFHYMFANSKIVDAGNIILPNSGLTATIYQAMFYECRSLVSAPDVIADYIRDSGCDYMFGNCVSLVNPPIVNVGGVGNMGMRYMFAGCTSLTTAPELPATTLDQYCYSDMFAGCTSLTSAPALPATTLADYCYQEMFKGCTSLTTSPVLPASALPQYCYMGMFSGCSSLNYIKCLATDISASNCTTNWVRGVYPTGTFVKSASMNSWTIGVNGIPVGWIIRNDGDVPIDCLSFKVASGNSGEIRWVSTTSAFTSTISYSKDNGTTWTSITSSTGNTAPSIPVNGGDIVLFKGNNLTYSLDSLYYLDHAYFKSNFYYSIEGNILSLVYGDTYSGQTELPQESGFTFSGLFIDNTGLTSASGLSLPATTLSKGCYSFMFQGCTNLTSIPELPATTLAESCYYGMFNYCSSLTTPPTLPATTLEKRCYAYMFGNCSSLTSAPALPVTALTESCYDCMFFKCVSLTTAPELPAEKMVHRCYYYMFAYCSSLNYIKCLANSGFEEEYTTVGWVNTVSSSGTFIKNQSASGWIVGDNGIPEYWTVQVA